MANKPTNNESLSFNPSSEMSIMEMIEANRKPPRFKNGFGVMTAVDPNDYINAPEIFLNVPKKAGDHWSINVVVCDPSPIEPVVSFKGARAFNIEEQVFHFEGDDHAHTLVRLDKWADAIKSDSITSSRDVVFNPCVGGEGNFVQVEYKGVVARVEWDWAESDFQKCGDIIISDFEGNKLRIVFDDEGETSFIEA